MRLYENFLLMGSKEKAKEERNGAVSLLFASDGEKIVERGRERYATRTSKFNL